MEIENNKRSGLLIGVIAVLGVCLIVGILLAMFAFKEKASKEDAYKETTGVVVGYETRTSSRRNSTSVLYAGIVEYQVNGVTYSIQQSTSSVFKAGLGKEYVVKYNPLNPRDAYIEGDYGILLFLGAFFIIVPVVLVIAIKDKSRKIVPMLLPMVFFLIGAGLMFSAYNSFGTINPLKIPLPISIIGYLFMLVPVIAVIGKIRENNKKVTFSTDRYQSDLLGSSATGQETIQGEMQWQKRRLDRPEDVSISDITDFINKKGTIKRIPKVTVAIFLAIVIVFFIIPTISSVILPIIGMEVDQSPVSEYTQMSEDVVVVSGNENSILSIIGVIIFFLIGIITSVAPFAIFCVILFVVIKKMKTPGNKGNGIDEREGK